MTLLREIQKLNTDNFVELIEIIVDDHTTLRFCSSSDTYIDKGDSTNPIPPQKKHRNVMFDGKEFIALPFEFTKVRKRTTGSLPRPILNMSNIGNVIGVIADSLLGHTLRRICTFEKFLDGKTESNPNAHFPIERYRINSIANRDYQMIALELTSFLDREGLNIPARTVVRNSCSHTYRSYDSNTEDFRYENVTCPYRGMNYFDKLNKQVFSREDDNCSRTINGCQRRFGTEIPLPIRSFPGVQE